MRIHNFSKGTPNQIWSQEFGEKAVAGICRRFRFYSVLVMVNNREGLFLSRLFSNLLWGI